MNRIPLLTPAQANPESRALLDQIHGAFGATPNMFRAVAQSSAALTSMWASFGTSGSGLIDARLDEQIAVAVANHKMAPDPELARTSWVKIWNPRLLCR